MSDTVMVGDEEWSLDGVPPHMIAHLPVEAEVTVKRIVAGIPSGSQHRVILERNGEPVRRGDRRGWSAGEREGWKAWPSRRKPTMTDLNDHFGDDLDVEAEEC